MHNTLTYNKIITALLFALLMCCASIASAQRASRPQAEPRVTTYDQAAAQQWLEAFYKRYLAAPKSATAKQGLTERAFNEYYKAGNGINGDIYDYLWEAVPSDGKPRLTGIKPIGEQRFEVELSVVPAGEVSEIAVFAIVTITVDNARYRIDNVELEAE